MRKSLTVTLVAVVGIAALAAFVLAQTALAAPGSRAGYHVLGVAGGGLGCRDMTNNLRAERESWSAIYASYTTGFITGANFVSYSANGRNANSGFDVPTETVLGSVERYCQQNQARNIHEAVTAVYSELAAH